MPKITPAVDNVKPVGKLPLANDHVMGAVPVAARGVLYAVPVVPVGSVVVIMIGATAVVAIVIDNAFVSLPTLLVAFTVKLEVPVGVDVPDISPAAESVKPVGKLPLSNDHVIGAVPVAASCALYTVPVKPLGSEVVVIIGGAFTTMDNAFVSLPTLLVAFTVKLNAPAAVGVPDIMPAAESVKPAGKLPLANDHVIGVVPVAVSV